MRMILSIKFVPPHTYAPMHVPVHPHTQACIAHAYTAHTRKNKKRKCRLFFLKDSFGQFLLHDFKKSQEQNKQTNKKPNSSSRMGGIDNKKFWVNIVAWETISLNPPIPYETNEN